jgi:hypothetical protein
MSRLEEIGKEQRDKLAPKNVYNSSDNAKNYSSTHPNSKAHDHGSDDPRDLKGKGTGIYLDTNPDNITGAGGYQDIFGNDSDISTGRINNLKVNKYKNGSGNEYTQPIIGANINQYVNPG